MYPECYTEALTCVELVLWSFVDCDGEYNLEFDSDWAQCILPEQYTFFFKTRVKVGFPDVWAHYLTHPPVVAQGNG